MLPHAGNLQRVIDQIAVTSPLYFYDWEPNLIGAEQTLGGHPGQQPPAAALKKARAEWEARGATSTVRRIGS